MRKIEKYEKNRQKCRDCGFCSSIIQCPSPNLCIGCRACYFGCPNHTIERHYIESSGTIEIQINGESLKYLDLLGNVYITV